VSGTINTPISAGLPNITGAFSMGSKNGASSYESLGAFQVLKDDDSVAGGRVRR
jgi:hypothetical protein